MFAGNWSDGLAFVLTEADEGVFFGGERKMPQRYSGMRT